MKLDKNITAIVTGGASGLGEAVARSLASAGVKVAIFDRDEGRGQRVAEDLQGLFYCVDVTSDASVDAGLIEARGQFGQERILVNCAGIANAYKTASHDRKNGAITHFPLDAFNQVIQVNLIGTFRCLAKSAAGMLTLDPLEGGERGVIINTASVAATDGQIGQAAYAASKAGVVGLALPVARDLMNDGIRINTILPGIFDTPLMQTAGEKVQTALAASVPFPKRLGSPNEFAQMVMTMIECGYLNGENIRLDGAIRMMAR